MIKVSSLHILCQILFLENRHNENESHYQECNKYLIYCNYNLKEF